MVSNVAGKPIVPLPILAHKRIRARLIHDYMKRAGLARCVSFSCGNASRELQKVVPTLAIAPNGRLAPTDFWWQPAEIRATWPNYFDATSGHLPADLMLELGFNYRHRLGDLEDKVYRVQTGSGETLVALAMAYPDREFIACYNGGPETAYSPAAVLNPMVRRLAKWIEGVG